jgi:hypothetical protein
MATTTMRATSRHQQTYASPFGAKSSNGLSLRGLDRCVILLALSACVVAVPTSRVWGALLPAGTFAFTAAETPVLGGTLVAGGVPIAFSSPTFNGTLTTSVISGDLNNGALGGLTFVYELTNNSASPGQIDRVTINGFNGSNIDLGFVLPGVAPGINDRSASSDVIGR